MSLHYLLDGYNILHQNPKLTHLDIDQQRLVFVRDIENFRPQGSTNNKVTLVFDGRRGRSAPIESTVVNIIHTLDETADDWIKRNVQQSANSKNFIVVTDDRDIQYSVRAAGAKLCSVKEFLARFSGSAPRNSSSFSKEIGQSTVEKINEELKSLWLKKKDPEEK
ncbi:MAG: NYN domain-containing protein [Candidatus Omnitrophica bacterium]|nr:NYN domain-containing protein [Candidatus Omnitrophota bacterium]